jgi:hypothetical protein
MKKGFYCSAGYDEDGFSDNRDVPICNVENCSECPAYHRKHPSPEQFKEEYKKDYPDDWAVYIYGDRVILDNEGRSKVDKLIYIDSYAHAKMMKEIWPSGWIVCACTPYGKPHKDFRIDG